MLNARTLRIVKILLKGFVHSPEGLVFVCSRGASVPHHHSSTFRHIDARQSRSFDFTIVIISGLSETAFTGPLIGKCHEQMS